MQSPQMKWSYVFVRRWTLVRTSTFSHYDNITLSLNLWLSIEAYYVPKYCFYDHYIGFILTHWYNICFAKTFIQIKCLFEVYLKTFRNVIKWYTFWIHIQQMLSCYDLLNQKKNIRKELHIAFTPVHKIFTRFFIMKAR